MYTVQYAYSMVQPCDIRPSICYFVFHTLSFRIGCKLLYSAPQLYNITKYITIITAATYETVLMIEFILHCSAYIKCYTIVLKSFKRRFIYI